jgi:cyclic pyranopterin phosphate synthase
MAASVVALHASHAGRAPLEALPSAQVIESAGLDGDRHSKPGNRRALLLMDHEVLEHFGLTPGAVREQITVRGVDLPKLVFGTQLVVGDAVLEVAAPCAPCERMDEIRLGLRAELDGRRGRFVRVVRGGRITVGDEITVESA